MKIQSKSHKQKRILLLEDEVVLARLYHKYLEAAGYIVRLCRTKDELLVAQESFMADVVFLDHGIKGEKGAGMDLIPILKEKNPDLLIVMLSNYSEFQMKERAQKAGAHDYLLKVKTPPKRLVEYVQQLLAC